MRTLSLRRALQGQDLLGEALSRLGRHEEALIAYEELCETHATRDNCYRVAIELQYLRRTLAAQEAARKAASLPGLPGNEPSYNQACYYAIAGKRAEALRTLKRLLELEALDLSITQDPDLASLNGEPQFEALVTELKGRLAK
jgi:tetratricopeptide (TPR) repeat protein